MNHQILIKNLLKTVSDNIMILDSEGYITGVSDVCAELIGYHNQEMTGMHFMDLNFGITLTQLLAFLNKAKNDHNSTFKTYLSQYDGHVINMSIKAIFIEEENAYLLSICFDETGFEEHSSKSLKHLFVEKSDNPMTFDLEEVMDTQLLQLLMDYFYHLTGIPVGIIDNNGKILVKEGWQDICVNFHRKNPEACLSCIESDNELTKGIGIGEFREYKCKNNMWDIASPIYVGGERMGHVFLGQFFYDDDEIDYEAFKQQAHQYGFLEEEYLAALSKVPRFSHSLVEYAMKFYTKIASYVSQLSYTNIKIHQTMEELYNLSNFQSTLIEAVPSPIFIKDKDLVYIGGNEAFGKIIGLSKSQYMGKTVFDLAGKDIADVYDKHDNELLESKTPQIYESYLVSKDGKRHDVIFNKAIFTDLVGESAGIIGVMQDISEIKNAERSLLKLNLEILDTQKEVIYTLGEIIESRSKEAAKHVIRVAEYSYFIALKYGMGIEEANLLKIASPMHDIGKIGIPDLILNKPGQLTPEEFEVIKTHPTIGYDILKKSKYKILQTASILALGHHEHWNGNGYPKGLSGKKISIYSRITTLADVFDAISHKRCYKEAWPLDQVKDYIISQNGLMFDPELVTIFIDNWDEILKIREKYPD